MFELLGGLSVCISKTNEKEAVPKTYNIKFWGSHMTVPFLSAEKHTVLPDDNGKFNMYI